ncbi:MAG TPA: flavin reductase family protein, partial [Pirellulales bacterium]|nr:flavin reductase family protein [Pirellulales bacterium]
AEFLSRIDRELWLVTAADGERRGGLIATFVCHASLVETLPRMLVALAKHHHTWQLVEASGAFGLHLLGREQLELVWRFGLQSGRDIDKFAGLATETSKTGAPLLTDALGWLDCRVEARFDMGDRTIYVAEVVDARKINDEPPLTMKQLLAIAPPERLEELSRLRQRDSSLDAKAILAWRKLATAAER